MAERYYRYGLLLLVTLAGGVYLFATVHGPGLLPDSIAYLKQARALSAGGSMFNLGTHYPPGVALLWSMAPAGLVGELFWIRLLGGLSHLVVLLCLAILLRRAAIPPLTVLLSLLLSVLVVTYSSQFWMGLSEAPSLALMALALVLLSYLDEGRSGRLIWSAFTICLIGMLLLRYASLAIVAALLLALLITPGHLSWRRFFSMALIGAVAVLPVLVWLLLSMQTDGQSGARSFSFHPPDAYKLAQLMATFSGWVGGLPALIIVGLFAGSIALSLRAPELRRRLPVVASVLLVVVYSVFLLTSITFFDGHTPLDARILSPLFLPLLYLLVNVGHNLMPRAMPLLLLLWSALSVPQFFQNWSQAIGQGLGYSTRGTAQMDILAATAKLQPKVPIYTNSPELFYLYQGREVGRLPKFYDPVTRRQNPLIAQQWEQILIDMRKHNAIVVWSPVSSFRTYLPTVEDMLAFGDLQIRQTYADGVILELKSPAQGSAAQAARPESSSGSRP